MKKMKKLNKKLNKKLLNYLIVYKNFKIMEDSVIEFEGIFSYSLVENKDYFKYKKCFFYSMIEIENKKDIIKVLNLIFKNKKISYLRADKKINNKLKKRLEQSSFFIKKFPTILKPYIRVLKCFLKGKYQLKIDILLNQVL